MTQPNQTESLEAAEAKLADTLPTREELARAMYVSCYSTIGWDTMSIDDTALALFERVDPGARVEQPDAAQHQCSRACQRKEIELVELRKRPAVAGVPVEACEPFYYWFSRWLQESNGTAEFKKNDIAAFLAAYEGARANPQPPSEPRIPDEIVVAWLNISPLYDQAKYLSECPTDTREMLRVCETAIKVLPAFKTIGEWIANKEAAESFLPAEIKTMCASDAREMPAIIGAANCALDEACISGVGEVGRVLSIAERIKLLAEQLAEVTAERDANVRDKLRSHDVAARLVEAERERDTWKAMYEESQLQLNLVRRRIVQVLKDAESCKPT